MEADAGIRVRLVAEASPPSGGEAAVACSPTRLLVVIPDSTWREKLAAVMVSADVEITTACAAEALEAAGRCCPDVMLVLLHQPAGEESFPLESLCELARGAGLVVVDSWPTMASALEALRRGAYAYLPWPQTAAALTTKVRAAHNLGLLLAECGSRSDSTRDEPPRSPETVPALAA